MSLIKKSRLINAHTPTSRITNDPVNSFLITEIALSVAVVFLVVGLVIIGVSFLYSTFFDIAT